MRLYVSSGITAQSDRESDAWRNRQTYSISRCGSSLVFSRSMKEESVLTPGGVAEGRSGCCEPVEAETTSCGDGGGGGGGYGERGFGESDEARGGVWGDAGAGVDSRASFRRD